MSQYQQGYSQQPGYGAPPQAYPPQPAYGAPPPNQGYYPPQGPMAPQAPMNYGPAPPAQEKSHGCLYSCIAAMCCCWLCGETCECCLECLDCCF